MTSESSLIAEAPAPPFVTYQVLVAVLCISPLSLESTLDSIDVKVTPVSPTIVTIPAPKLMNGILVKLTGYPTFAFVGIVIVIADAELNLRIFPSSALTKV